MNKRKVCIVAPVHIWDDVRVYKKEACTLAHAGYQVSLIARTPSQQTVNGIKIIPSIGSSSIRLLRFLLLPIVGIQALLQNAHIYHLHNPDTLPIAFLLRLFAKNVIYDTHEDFTQRIMARDWIPRLLRAPLAYLVGKTETFVSSIATASIATQENVAKRLNKKVLLLGNPPRINNALYAKVGKLAKKIEPQDNWLRAVYIGSINNSRGLNEMVDALEIVNKTAEVRLWLIGPADINDLNRAMNRHGWKYVDYISRIEQEMAFAYVERADVGLVVIRNVGDHATTDPNKLYEYMMFGKPYIATAFNSWIDKLGDLDAGWFVMPESAGAIADALLEVANNDELARSKGARGKKFTSLYNWESESQKLLELYSQI